MGGLSTQEILARYRPGKAPPMRVPDVPIELSNTFHTYLEKTVSHKTGQHRAQFLRRFVRDLNLKTGFKMAPDPRNLGKKHIRAMVQVWRDERLAPATILTCPRFLRGLARWMDRPGFVLGPAHCGLSLKEYQRHGTLGAGPGGSARGVSVG